MKHRLFILSTVLGTTIATTAGAALGYHFGSLGGYQKGITLGHDQGITEGYTQGVADGNQATGCLISAQNERAWGGSSLDTLCLTFDLEPVLEVFAFDDQAAVDHILRVQENHRRNP